jgi:hypothetical protein
MLQKLIEKLRNCNIRQIIAITFIFKLIAILFSKGYGMFDDHFLIIEPANSWVKGFDYNNWLPSADNKEPKGFNFFYTGLHYLLFRILTVFQIEAPQIQMYIVRLLHALWSTPIIYFGYKLVEKQFDEEIARKTAWVLGLYFIMPWLSVRNLIEFVCVMPALAALYWSQYKKSNVINFLITGFFFGLSFNIRYQAVILFIGFLAVLAFDRKWKEFFYSGIGATLMLIAIQGSIDFLVWKKPFIQLISYFFYNTENATTYFNHPWYNYLLTISGFLLPPFGIFLLYFWLKSVKKMPYLFWPALIFIVFHSFYPNKQERFIIPALIFILIQGFSAWQWYLKNNELKPVLKKAVQYFFYLAMVINFIALPVVSASYNKRNFVESATYMSTLPNNQYFIIDEAHAESVHQLPTYYLGIKPKVIEITSAYSVASFMQSNPEVLPKYVLFITDQQLQERLNAYQPYFELKLEAIIEPGLVDLIVHKLNPINENQTCLIYQLLPKQINH